MKLTPDQVARTIGGEWLAHPDAKCARTAIREISIDSRTVCAGDLFWAIKGERFDGNDFVDAAIEQGAVAAVVSRATGSDGVRNRLIKVDDTLASLRHMAAEWRARHSCRVIAVTGSSGKTTTKELISSILMQRYNCLKTEGNKNNLIGVSLTLLHMAEGHEAAVVELGMNHLGEIAQLTSMVRPSIGVITNIGRAHIGFLGSVNCIIDAKSELLQGMDSDGMAVLNRDDPYYYILVERCPNGVITVGESDDADVRIHGITLLPEEGMTEVTVIVKGEPITATLPILGRTAAYNLSMAVAVALHMGCGKHEIMDGVAAFTPVLNRMHHKVVRGIHILDDSYNANPESMHSALNTLSECKGSNRSVAILGDMLELGNQSECLHRQLGQWLGHNRRLDFLITIGPQARIMAEEAVKMGYPCRNVWSLKEHEEISLLACSLVDSGDWVLIKGSRLMGLDRVSARIVELINARNGVQKRMAHTEGLY
ncbi:MAG: UDP-N-acetylmuramoyl-tripeptide--D-alanyl-D-alanine ligase [bacterium]